MKYYLIAGEASGDLHASHLMKSLKEFDDNAEFRFWGGDLMTAVGGTRVRHYRELAYMGFVPVLLHLPTILSNMRRCKRDIVDWQPDCVILVDYPGFNLTIAKYVKSKTNIPVYYYISPKIWAWKEYRIKNIRRDVDELFSILPFEVPFFEQRHHYPIHYVGNPTADEVREFLSAYEKTAVPTRPIIALLAGSRKQEIKDNLPAMMEAVSPYMSDYQVVLAGAPGIEKDYYDTFLRGKGIDVVYNQTYPLLAEAHAALVTSGTATLETCLFKVPQVVCYETPLPRLIGWLRKKVLRVKYISLVNLIADREVVTELVADTFSVTNIRRELEKILDGPVRQSMLDDYEEISRRLGHQKAPEQTAKLIYTLLSNQ
ncbi:lipid-A-disaccharide synthase [Prevotella aff. ruminicola Tc2-24]|uniref:Lipid-A-disaccharide synthase n=1 Tax=Prevotella aff. ruminicola Tc2-24 TaxID=81582 RepID=A0A1I0PF92_9BACT|nr:lipid-A-disaccharide synthase [Prevotella aff. ruminicola Tc2-24]SEW13091.1 lipid-A-disaccharide synthase [Prevotella aff. ruminicola Tc2-24]